MTARTEQGGTGERGFTVLLMLLVLLFAAGLLAAALDAVYSDAGLTRNDLDQKRAYRAAQAGIAAFTQQLDVNVNYWQSCPGWPSPTTTAVPGSTDNGSTEYYATQIVPATGSSSCSLSSPATSVVESSGAASGTFRVRSTGTSNGVKRTIVAQYARTSFLNFIYYTNYETLDPLTYSTPPTDCTAHYPSRGADCIPIEFITGDSVNGPLHSEDTLLICGTPSFGRTSSDRIEAAGFSDEGIQGCTASPGGPGTRTTKAASLLPPPSDASLLGIAQSGGDVFTGETTIVLNGSNMTVTNANVPGGVETVPFPSNGVVYVSSTSCASTYTPYGPSYGSDPSCGNVYVSGNYNSSLTIGSDNDVIINGNITTPVNSSGTPTGNALLGLIANDFVRIYHPLSGPRVPERGGSTHCTNTTPANGPINTVYAAILAVNHSFIVDNYDCGASLGTLEVYGAIGQLYRGTVGTTGGYDGQTGYLKNYIYDQRLAIAEPPYFLNPVQAAWRVQRQTECTGC